jgi:hypothetical protein
MGGRQRGAEVESYKKKTENIRRPKKEGMKTTPHRRKVRRQE